MAFSDVAAKIAQGLAGVGNNPQASQEVGQWQQNRAQQKNAPAEMSLQAHSLAVNGLRQKLSALDPNSPDYAKQHDDLVHQMAQQVGAMREIVAPDQNLGPLDRLKQLTTDKLHITNHAGRLADLQRQQQSGAEQDQGTASAYAASAVPFAQTEKGQAATQEGNARVDAAKKLDDYKRQSIFGLIDKYIPDPKENAQAKREYTEKQAGIYGQPKNLTGAAGQPVEFPPNSGRYAKAVQNADGTTAMVPMPDGWKPAPPKLSMTPKVGTANGKNVYALLTSQGWVDAGTKQPLNDFRPLPTYAQMGAFRVEPMQLPDGSITSALLNGKTGAFKPIVTTDGQPIAPSLMKQVNDSLAPAIAADTRLRIMKENEKDALEGNQQAMLSLVANHIGMTLGAQKGARINQAVWNEAVESAPWMQNVKKKFGPDGMLQGVALSPEQIRQMVGLAVQRRDAQWTQAKQAGDLYGVKIPMPDDLGGSEKSHAVSTPKKGASAKPEGAVGTVTYQGKKYWVDKEKNNLGEVH